MEMKEPGSFKHHQKTTFHFKTKCYNKKKCKNKIKAIHHHTGHIVAVSLVLCPLLHYVYPRG